MYSTYVYIYQRNLCLCRSELSVRKLFWIFWCSNSSSFFLNYKWIFMKMKKKWIFSIKKDYFEVKNKKKSHTTGKFFNFTITIYTIFSENIMFFNYDFQYLIKDIWHCTLKNENTEIKRQVRIQHHIIVLETQTICAAICISFFIQSIFIWKILKQVSDAVKYINLSNLEMRWFPFHLVK